MKYLKTYKLFESPDIIYYNGRKYEYSSSGAWAFGYKDGRFYIVGEETHVDMLSGYDRDDFENHGRIWTEQKIISFWKYPQKEELKYIIEDIEEHTGEDIWNNGYSIEVIDSVDNSIDRFLGGTDDWGYTNYGTYIPLENYVGSGEWDDETLAKQHILSPMVKKRNVSDEYWKVRAKKEKPLPLKYKMYAEKIKS